MMQMDALDWIRHHIRVIRNWILVRSPVIATSMVRGGTPRSSPTTYSTFRYTALTGNTQRGVCTSLINVAVDLLHCVESGNLRSPVADWLSKVGILDLF